MDENFKKSGNKKLRQANQNLGFSMMSKRKVLKIDLKERKSTKKEDFVAIDKPINLFINGKHFVTFMASPKNLRELAIGHLLGDGVIGGLDDLEKVRVKGVNVEVRTKSGIRSEAAESIKVIPTACGATEDLVGLLGGMNIPKPKFTEFEAGVISSAFKSLQSSSEVFQDTGGTHAAALFTREGEMIACAEDVGRHNAVDKIIGKGLIEGIDFAECFLISSGRLPADMVVKCLRAGIPLVASKAAPLESGILAAEAGGLTLVGFVRGSRLNVYTHPGRVKF